MSPTDVANAAVPDEGLGDQDLGPLAWVLDEIRKSLDGAVKALRRFVHDAEIARESDLASLDVGTLRVARQQMHQASGALEMVGMSSPALVLHAMEGAVQRFVQRPELCSDDAAGAIERASFALSEYLEIVLGGKAVSPVALFPQYRDVQALTGAERVHPADLWPAERRFREPEIVLTLSPVPYGIEARARLDHAVLRIVKDSDFDAAHDLRDLSLGLAAAQEDRQVRAFWKISAAFFDAFARGLLVADVYVKRVASRVLMQYAALARGELTVSHRLVQDLLFFCAQAKPPADEPIALLTAVRDAFGLKRYQPVDYEARRFGRFDPAVLAQARKRISAAAETWSALAGGDRNKLKPAADQFSLVCDSLRKLNRSSESLAQALTRTMDQTVRSGEPPSAPLAMEVATSVLYLQAALEETDTADHQMAARADGLARRLDEVAAGRDPAPLEPWMEDLYRRVSDHQTMGSVVDELRATLGEAERSMDQFFRNPDDTTPLTPVPARLSQMRGVLSVLGLDQASHAVLRMRDSVEHLLVGNAGDATARKALFERLGNSLGALGFMIDMLSYQRAMARKLFVYDEEQGELRLIAGRSRTRASDVEVDVDALAQTVEERSMVPLPDVVPRRPLELPVQPPGAATPEPEILEIAETPFLPPSVDLLAEPAMPGDDPAFQGESSSPEDLDTKSNVEPADPVEALAVEDPAPQMHLREMEVEDELLEIFLEEAREVVATGLAAAQVLAVQPGDLSEQTTLRRAFHTLKGSSRMVGLNAFGEAAWSMEQLLNAWLAEQKPIERPLLQTAEQALEGFGRWADAIAASDDGLWNAAAFSKVADALRADGRVLPLELPSEDEIGIALLPTSISEDLAPETGLSNEVSLPAAADLEELELPPDFSDTAIFDIDVFASESLSSDQTPELLPETDEIDFSEFEAALDTSGSAAPENDFASFGVSNETQESDLSASEPTPTVEPDEELFAKDALDVHLSAFSQAQQAGAVDDSGHTVASEDSDPLSAPVEEYLSEVVRNDLALDQETIESAEHDPAQQSELTEASDTDDNVKVIGHLRIGIPLYNVYLNEADEWSRRLSTCLQEWSLELFKPLPDTAVALAHSLGGSSATVGFDALSQLARLLEHALSHIQLQARGEPEHADAFLKAADEVRRLLHQFAAGFLKTADADVEARLRQILETEISTTLSPSLDDADADGASALTSPTQAIEPAAVERGVVAPALSIAPRGAVAEQEAEESAHGRDLDDDIDVEDVIDPDLFPIFEEEAAELLPQLGGALRQWAARPDNLGSRNEVLRALHTLKGSSRLAGAMRLGELAHRLESAIEQLDAETVRSVDIEPLLGSFDALQANFKSLKGVDSDTAHAAQAQAQEDSSGESGSADASAGTTAAATQARPSVLERPLGLNKPAVARPVSSQSVRVRAQLLDRLVNQAGEVMITRSRMESRLSQLKGSMGDLSTNLTRLRQQLRDIEVQSESQMQSRLALSKDTAAGFDPLEFDRFTRVQELTRMMAESVNDVATVQRNLQRVVEGTEDDLISQGRQARELQRDLLRTRMVEFEGIAERLYAVVRQSSKEAGKQVKLDIIGGSIEMDRGVLDRMTPAFEHLLRNCVAHGIETPDQREAAGKSSIGTIGVALRHEGNDVSVEFRDDGAGLNLDAIRERAVQQKLIESSSDVTDQEAAELIFTPGFSTANEVTELSGRGIGMDVVRSEVQALGGRVETSTDAGAGSAFRLVLPLTTAVTQVVMLRAGDLAFGVPATVVELVRRVPVAEIEESYASGHLEVSGEQVPFFWAGALLQASNRSQEGAGKTRSVVILRSASQRIAIHVDDVLGNQEVVVKNLGPQLSRLAGLAGMSVLASGAVVLIYNPVALATVHGDQLREMQARFLAESSKTPGSPQPAGAMAAHQVPLILVVDDSITVRRVTQRLLLREGYRVALAADGLQALERLQEERPTVILSDIEMPRMDGFDLARNIRADEALRDLPIIMITSRIAQKHRDHAIELGVDHYLGKPYSDEELLSLVQSYARKSTVSEAANV